MIAAGLDLSLGGAGIALAQWDRGDHRQHRVGLDRIGSAPTGRSIPERSKRLRGQAAQIVAGVCAWGTPDLVAVEAPLMGGKQSGSSHDRSGLWWLILARLDANGVPCVEVINSQLKQHALGKGSGAGTDKDYVLSATIRRFGHLIQRDAISNDEADALWLASLAATHLGHPLIDLPESHLRPLRTIQWP